jgi:hypothetical protein
MQVALFALVFDPACLELEALAPENLNNSERNLEGVKSRYIVICDAKFIATMRPKSNPVGTYKHFNSDESGGAVKIPPTKFQKVVGEFNIKLKITELQEMIRLRIVTTWLHFFLKLMFFMSCVNHCDC